MCIHLIGFGRYVLNRGWIDRSDRHVPTYDEIVGPADLIKGSGIQANGFGNHLPDGDEDEDEDEDEGGDEAENAQAGPSQPWGVLDEDDFDERAEEFENAYNFRFEEP